jgi:predicted transcriptional regulator
MRGCIGWEQLMSVTVTLELDDDVGAYLERLASGPGRTPAEVAAWIVTEDLRREQAIDDEIVARLDARMAAGDEPLDREHAADMPVQRERAGA